MTSLPVRQSAIPLFVLMLLGSAPLAFVAASEVKPFAQSGERGFARMVYFGDNRANPIAGEFWFQYGQPDWKSEYEKQLESPDAKRWRFGKDAWTSFDTCVEVTIGGQKVPPGLYYVAIEHPAKDKWGLVFLDPAPLRAAKMDAFGAANSTGGIVAPLTHSAAEKAADKLSIAITAGKKPNDGAIEITFGPHKLSVPFVAKV